MASPSRIGTTYTSGRVVQQQRKPEVPRPNTNNCLFKTCIVHAATLYKKKQHIPPWEKKNHLQNWHFSGYVSSLKGGNTTIYHISNNCTFFDKRERERERANFYLPKNGIDSNLAAINVTTGPRTPASFKWHCFWISAASSWRHFKLRCSTAASNWWRKFGPPVGILNSFGSIYHLYTICTYCQLGDSMLPTTY